MSTQAIPRILMCLPDHYGIEYEINPWMNLSVKSDHERSQRQWRALHDLFVEFGVRVELVPPVLGLPDMVFTANAGLVYRDRIILSRFRYGERQREAAFFDAWFAEHGFDVLSMPEGVFFEGAGDALFCGETLFAGYRFRSDARGHQWIGTQLGVEVLPLELVDPRFYHLDTCFCPVDPTTALYYPAAFDEYGRSVLHATIPNLIEVAAGEATSFSCNAVVVGRSVVVHAGAPLLAHTLRARGLDVHMLELSEFIKAGGSAKCLTLRLDGEDAAAWRMRNA